MIIILIHYYINNNNSRPEIPAERFRTSQAPLWCLRRCETGTVKHPQAVLAPMNRNYSVFLRWSLAVTVKHPKHFALLASCLVMAAKSRVCVTVGASLSLQVVL